MTTAENMEKFDVNEIINTESTSLIKPIKNYLLDTNILMSNPNAIFGFEENNVYLCGTVLQELDKHKDDEGERGYNAREAIRIIKSLISAVFTNVTKEDRLHVIREVGIELPNGGRLFFEPDGVDITNLPKGYSIDRADNKIISSCVHMNNDYLKDNPVTLLTNDAGCYINALVCGVNAEDVRNEQVKNIGYTGQLDLDIEDWNIINKIYSENFVKAEDILEVINLEYPLLENQFVTLHCGNQNALTVHQRGILHKIPDNLSVTSKHIKPLNKMQRYAMWALMNPDIPLVILEGQAGCVDCDTEFFNGFEWKKISKWTNTDKVLQFDTKTNQATLVTPNAYIKLPCKEMYHFETKYGLDQTLSDDHTILYYNRASHRKGQFNGPYEITTKDFITKQTKERFRGVFNTVFTYSGTGIDLTDIEIKLMCMIICDGAFNPYHPNSKRCTINIKKERKIQQAQQLLDEAQIEYKKYNMSNGYIRFVFNAPKREKEFLSYWYNCTNAQLQIVCDNILLWDGCTTNNHMRFSSSSKNTIDFVQFAFTACGYRAVITESNLIGQIRELNNKQYIRKSTIYNINITKRTMVGITNDIRDNHTNTPIIKVNTIDGYKYCFNVPTHALVLRRNNKIFITGNCAKTFLSLACGYAQLDVGDHSKTEPYSRILISRPNNRTTDQDFGYLPGDLEEKMGPLMASYMDNLEQILGDPDTSIIQTKRQIEDMIYDGNLEFCPLYTIRGRSIQNGYLICDEAQNATKNLIRDVVTRAGKNTKIVVAGDPRQIDNTSLDSHNNGLVYLKDCMKGSPLCAIIRFDDSNCVRSDLAEEAIMRMK